ncbi:GntR family transcriptional regulator [Nocardioides sp. HDW12B]|nr:GntR family transcriptional regulator [Nocardioides sp. HDW12B]
MDSTSAVPPFEQLRSGIAGLVARGELPAGARLDTVRQLATDLGLAANTVAKAYRALEADGVITTEGRRGTFVRSRHLEKSSGTLDQDAAAFARSARRAGLSREEATRLLERAWES